MELLNATAKLNRDDENAVALRYEIYNDVVLMLYPITPHICYVLYQMLGNEGSIDNDATWPKADPNALKDLDLLIVVQVNGKLRARVTVAPDASEDEVKKIAFANADVARHTEGKEIKKVIYVKGRLLNIVVGK